MLQFTREGSGPKHMTMWSSRFCSKIWTVEMPSEIFLSLFLNSLPCLQTLSFYLINHLSRFKVFEAWLPMSSFVNFSISHKCY